jgi:uncharacterized protein (TIGR03435 family)
MRMTRLSILLALTVLAASIVGAQDDRRLSFEAASIKSNPTPTNGALRGRAIVCQGIDGLAGRPAFVGAGPVGAPGEPIPQGRCRGSNVTLLTLVSTAYGVSEHDVSGGPSWLSSDGFQVEAKAENTDATTTEQLRRMLQTLLADRFRLRVRREQREALGFILAVAGNGLKLKEAAGNERPLHTELTGQRGQQRVTILGRSSITDFVAVLSSLPFTTSAFGGAPLLDKTELVGIYNFNLTLNFADRSGGPPELDPVLSKALQEQLGLRLLSGRIPIEAIVIDQAEKPSEN